MNTFDPKKIDNKIIQSKQFLRSRSNNFEKNFINIENYVKKEVQEIENLIKKNKKIIPEVDYQDIVNNTIESNTTNIVKKRGCVIIRNVFNKNLVNQWNEDLSDYIDSNKYYDDQKKKAGLDQYFSDLKSGKPQIFGLYWSKPQIEIRQSENMAKVKTWLNKLWQNKHKDKIIFFPNKELVYADRIRRRQAGDN